MNLICSTFFHNSQRPRAALQPGRRRQAAPHSVGFGGTARRIFTAPSPQDQENSAEGVKSKAGLGSVFGQLFLLLCLELFDVFVPVQFFIHHSASILTQ
ncbi:unnamed protein product [Amoebophrya sp. A120]|nr:unnamed protein product [Amoebophrya sp. A120]|eukprot:GSA120T00004388001.1